MLGVKKIHVTLFGILLYHMALAQKTSFSIAFNSGLFSFHGASAASVSRINFDDPSNRGYTNNPYGTQGGLMYGVSGNIRRIYGNGLIVGLDAGFESGSSRIHIEGINGHKVSSSYYLSADGTTRLVSSFLNFFPHGGIKLNFSKVNFDLIGGMDVAYCLNTLEKGKALAEVGANFTTWVERKTVGTDFRPRIQIAAHYQKMCIYLGYSHGLVNYLAGYIGGENECYSRIIRMGIGYQFF